MEVRQGIREQREIQGGQVHFGGGAVVHRVLKGMVLTGEPPGMVSTDEPSGLDITPVSPLHLSQLRCF